MGFLDFIITEYSLIIIDQLTQNKMRLIMSAVSQNYLLNPRNQRLMAG